ncbi:MAG: hypothetical protein SOW45_07275 [Prevotella sp.]|nr:hypothetical protein [Prevotella sp.]
MQKYTQFSYLQNFSRHFIFAKAHWMMLGLADGFPAKLSTVMSEKMTIKRAIKNDKIGKIASSEIHLQYEKG